MSLRLSATAFAVAFLVVSTSRPVAACSVCRCGDPTFNALGTDVFEAGRFRLALDVEHLEKEQGLAEHEAEAPGARGLAAHVAADEAGAVERLVETRSVLTLAYGFSERFQLVGRLPWSRRELSGEGEAVTADALADPELYGMLRLWSSPWQEGLGRRSWLSLVAGVKTAWGKNDARRGGERLDEHAQAGTGTTDPFAGLSFVHLLDASSTLYASAQYRRTGRNGSGYRYGAATLANFGYERKLSERWDATVELNARHAARDEVDASGEEDPNTGGSIAFLSPRVLVDLGGRVVGRLGAQFPVLDALEGEQEEKAVWSVGVTVQF